MAGDMGCAVNMIFDAAAVLREEGKDILQGSKARQDAEYQDRTLTASMITGQVYDELKDKKEPSESEQWQMKRHRLERELCLDLDELASEKEREAIFKQWNQGRGAKFVQALVRRC